MVSSRQLVLKKELEDDLQKKVMTAQGLIRSLRGAIVQVKDNSSKAKTEVNEAVDSVQVALANRKLELNRQIDLICHTQVNSLQEEIQGTLIALGSLQSTLANLDSFDNGQLLNLSIPDLSWDKSCSTPAPIVVNLASEDVQKSVKEWGGVNANGLKGLVEIGTTASMPQRFVEYGEEKANSELMYHKSVSSELPSVISFRAPPKLPESISIPAGSGNEASMQFGSSSSNKHLDQWLTKVSTESCPESDDFEMVCVGSNSEAGGDSISVVDKASDSDLDEPAFTLDDDTQQTEEKVAVSRCSDSEDIEDISAWLGQKKSLSVSGEIPRAKPADICLRNGCQEYATCNNRFVDFPCLRVDPKNWVCSKKKSTAGASMKMGQSEIIPPSYALPAPFWLKKYR